MKRPCSRLVDRTQLVAAGADSLAVVGALWRHPEERRSL